MGLMPAGRQLTVERKETSKNMAAAEDKATATATATATDDRAQDDKPRTLNRAGFLQAWDRMAPLILQEWETVDEESLEKTEGDLDKVVALVAERTARTKAMVRRLLFELYQVVHEQPQRTRSAQRRRSDTRPESVEAMVHELERRAAQVMRELRGGLLRDTNRKIHDNLFFSLLVTLGLGFIVGVLFTGSGRGRS